MANTTITPSTGIGRFTTDIRPFVASGALAFSGGTSVLGRAITPTAGSSSFSGIAPMFGTVIAPVVATVVLTGVSARLNLSITPAAASATILGVNVTLINGRTIAPLVGALLVSGVSLSLGLQIVSPSGQVTETGAAPNLLRASIIGVSSGVLGAVGLTSILITNTQLLIGTGSNTFQGITPIVRGAAVAITPLTGSAQYSGYAPIKPVVLSIPSCSLMLSSDRTRVVATISFSNGYLLPLNGPIPQVLFSLYQLPEVA